MKDEKVTWTSDGATIATVDVNGTIKGVKAGTTTVKASDGNISASIEHACPKKERE